MKRIKVEFTGKNLTGQAGFIHMRRFIKKLGLHGLLERHITIKRGDNARYSVADAVVMLVMGALTGVKHMSHMAVLRADQVIRRLFDWEAFPDDRTFGRIFELFGQSHCHELSNAEAFAREGMPGPPAKAGLENPGAGRQRLFQRCSAGLSGIMPVPIPH